MADITHDNFIAGLYPRVDVEIKVLKDATDGVMPKGTVLALNTTSGKCERVDKAGTAGTAYLATPYCILAEDIDVTAADVVSYGYLSGEFYADALVFKADNAIADFKSLLRDLNIYVK